MSLQSKLKCRWLRQYVAGLERDSLEAKDYWHMARSLSWRMHHTKQLLRALSVGACDWTTLQQALDGMPVCRQIEDDLFDYQERLTELTEAAADGEMTPEEYESAVEELA